MTDLKSNCCICKYMNCIESNTTLMDINDINWRIIHEGEHFCVTPSLGQIIEGYTVLWSKRHISCFANLSTIEMNEILDFIPNILYALNAVYETPVFIFEHGQVNGISPVGCGIDHAHLHLVPVKNDSILESMVKDSYTSKETFSSIDNCLKAFSPSEDYILFGRCPGTITIYSYGEERISQAIRRLLAASQGTPDKWDWRQYNDAINVLDVCNVLKAHLPSLNFA